MLSFGKFGFNLLTGLTREFHLPGYQFCGPGTDYEGRVARGDTGINTLDKLCKSHDAVYNITGDYSESNAAKRLQSDKLLRKGARRIWKGSEFGWRERLDAALVDAAIGIKNKMAIY